MFPFSVYYTFHCHLDVIIGFFDYLAMSSQGQIGEMITVGTLLGKVGVWIGMVRTAATAPID